MNNYTQLIQDLKQISYNFSFISELKRGENLQPTSTTRQWVRTFSYQQEHPVQKTLDLNVGLYAYLTDAYSDTSFDSVTKYYTTEIKKAQDIFDQALKLCSSLPQKSEEKKHIVTEIQEAYRAFAKSRVGFSNWQVTLCEKLMNKESLKNRVTVLKSLIMQQSTIVDDLYKKCVLKFSEPILQKEKDIFFDDQQENIKILSSFASKNALLKGASPSLLLIDETFRYSPSDYIYSQNEMQECINLIQKTINVEVEKATNFFKKGDFHLLNKMGELKDFFQQELTLLLGLKNIQEMWFEHYSNKEEYAEALQSLKEIVRHYENFVHEHGEFFLHHIEKYKQSTLSQSILNPLSFTELDFQDATKRLDAYVAFFSPNITLEKARDLCSQGKLLYQQILEGKIFSPLEYAEGEEMACTAIAWFLMRMALNKGQGHIEGAFTIEDYQDRLYSFLLNAKSCGDRPSSHYVGRSPEWNGVTQFLMKASHHRGIDVINGLLPAGKRHILFGKVQAPSFNEREPKDILFLKLEEFSPFMTTGYGYDMMMHGAELCIAQYNKIYKPGSDDLKEMAKERVPSHLLRNFNQIIDTLLKNTPRFSSEDIEINKAKHSAKLFGISYMAFFVNTLKETDPGLSSALGVDAFYETLLEHDHVEKRTGREVYLTFEELSVN